MKKKNPSRKDLNSATSNILHGRKKLGLNSIEISSTHINRDNNFFFFNMENQIRKKNHRTLPSKSNLLYNWSYKVSLFSLFGECEIIEYQATKT